MKLKTQVSEPMERLSTFSVPDEFKSYHELTVQALKSYYEMLDYLIRSSMAINESDKKIFLDKAASKITGANTAAKEAMKLEPAVYDSLRKRLKQEGFGDSSIEAILKKN